MSNLAWIKLLYRHEPISPTPRLRKFAILVSLIVGLATFITKMAWIPLVASLCFALTLSNKKISHLFISFTGSGIFIFFHTITLLCLVATYYCMLVPLSLLRRWTQKEDLFFMKPGSSTLRIQDINRKPNFERQF